MRERSGSRSSSMCETQSWESQLFPAIVQRAMDGVAELGDGFVQDVRGDQHINGLPSVILNHDCREVH